jgi:hypothetical protein
MTDAVAARGRCANCRAPLTDAYCAHCGQKDKPLDPTMRELAGDVLSEVTDVDSRVLRSVRYLFTRPGFLSREHAEGRRAAYVSPVRLYLIFSVAFFATASLVAQREGMFALENTPGPAVAGASAQATFETWLPRIMFVLVPLCGVCVMGFTRSARRNYPAHFHFSLHLHAFWFALFALMAPLEWVVSKRVSDAMSLGRIVVLLVYGVIAFRTAYGGGWWRSVGRTAGVFASYMLLVGLTFAAIVGGVIISSASAGSE